MSAPHYYAADSFRQFCYYFLLAPGDKFGNAIMIYKLVYLVGFFALFPYSIYLAYKYEETKGVG